MMVIVPPFGTTLAVVNETTILRLDVLAIRSEAAIIKAVPVTMPPRAREAPTPARSVVEDTATPVAEAAMGPPIVAPVRVSVYDPAAILEVVATMYWDAKPEVVVAKPVPRAPMVPKM